MQQLFYYRVAQNKPDYSTFQLSSLKFELNDTYNFKSRSA